ncbi:MAG: hypothetical protein ACPF9W_08080 [Nocardioides sp.]
MSKDPARGTRTEEAWTQPFGWGLLMAFDAEAEWELPEGVGTEGVAASASCLAVPVHHTSDVDFPEGWPDDLPMPGAQVNVVVAFTESPPGSPVHFDGNLSCPTGRLSVGDAENDRVLDVPAGTVRVQVSLFPFEDADSVVLRILSPQ